MDFNASARTLNPELPKTGLLYIVMNIVSPIK